VTTVALPLPTRRDASGPTAHVAAPVAVPGQGDHKPELLALDAGEQYRFGFDMGACIGCHSCEVACAEQNGLPEGTVWRRVGEIEGGLHPDTKRFHLSMSCNHCLDPACLNGCPTNAYEKLANGIVAHHAEDCVGCQYCTWSCPYSVPAFQPDRRIVTKCDLCRPRLDEGMLPACVDACPTHAIIVEKVDVEAWRADHREGDAPQLPSADLTLSTTRIVLPADIPIDTYAASDWNVRPEHPHWPLVWLTLLSQLAVGVSLTAGTFGDRLVGAGLAGAALVGALFHLGRPAVAYKALRNLRRSWLSREVLLLSVYAGVAAGAVVVPGLVPVAAAVGVAGVFASAMLYVVPGRPAWNSPLTIVRFFATALATGPVLTGHTEVAAVAAVLALVASLANWARLQRTPGVPTQGSVRLDLHWFRWWTIGRFVLLSVALGLLVVQPAAAFVLIATGESIGRWLFFVTVVPLNMPGAFWRGTAGTHR
jgi:formate dehydrogenase iron-sulfur subunit